MDGMTSLSAIGSSGWNTRMERTLKAAIGCVGVGLHCGQPVQVTIRPAPAGLGIVFHRTDLGVTIPARYDYVTDTRLCTMVSIGEARVGTIEHLMAAFAGLGVCNAIVELDGPELPVLDGSSAPWLFLLDCAGVVEQLRAARVIEVLRAIRVTEGEAFAELRPGPAELDLALSIDFAAPAIGRQALSLTLTEESFRADLADARTFTLAHEIAGLRAAGLARGGSLDNAIVVDGAVVLNPSGLRRPDEFVRHKMLDAVGDLALAGAALQGRFVGRHSGHALNNRVLRALFADRSNWRDAQSFAAMEHVSVAA